MNDGGPPQWLRGMAVAQTTSTIYASLGVCFGGLMYLVAPRLGGNPWGWFFVGTVIPPGPLYLLFTSDWMFERRLKNLKRWADMGLMPPARYEESVARAFAWRDERLYGKQPDRAVAVTSRSRAPKSVPSKPAEPKDPPAPEPAPTTE
jgi:hypothetical protein